ncbi:hypothetical protein IE81DRAFT_320296 [Ceraceosorus guamensis]|uniref:Transmembrane protein 135 N-terminal domain-containing protein n=1 Tax=Ceraceosorus guamensis TaxID=1522189 RepID=A0A316W7H5_9BASI|nr:hypothetical protein IE81DRAFT_320296 [Ceraceosorus guamensis]PWN45534.1 hypothetical protein IE81DRAFT_320296 [Ceraceosorus guamensis]
MSHERKNSWLGGSISGEPSSTSSGYPFWATFILTHAEAKAARRVLAKTKVVSPSPPASAAQTPISQPATPVAPVPPRIAALSYAIASGAKDESSGDSPNLWQQDAALPLTSRTAIRAFLLGYLANTALESLVPAVLRKKSPADALRSLASRTSARVGGALALYALLYRTLVQALSLVRARALVLIPKPLSGDQLITHRDKALASVLRLLRSASLVPLAAAISSIPALTVLPGAAESAFPRQDIAVDLMSKAIVASYHESRRLNSPLTRWIPGWVNSTLLYAISNGQLLHAFVFDSDCFPKGYGDLIMARSSAYVPPRPQHLPDDIPWPSGRTVVDNIAALSTPSKTASAYPAFSSPLLSALTPSKHPTSPYDAINPLLDYAPAHPSHANLLCAVLHPRDPSCSNNFVSFWKREWVASAKFVAAVMAVLNLIGIKKVIKDPETAIFKYGMAVLQGATLISGSIGSAWALICFFQHWLPRNLLPQARYFLNGFLSSIFIFAVPPARRQQLGMYVGRLSAKSYWATLVKHKRVKPVKNGEALLLGAALAILATLYEARPEALSGGMKGFLSRIVGPRQGGSLGLEAAPDANVLGKDGNGGSNGNGKKARFAQ